VLTIFAAHGEKNPLVIRNRQWQDNLKQNNRKKIKHEKFTLCTGRDPRYWMADWLFCISCRKSDSHFTGNRYSSSVVKIDKGRSRCIMKNHFKCPEETSGHFLLI
jgi:hypothetical protein